MIDILIIILDTKMHPITVITLKPIFPVAFKKFILTFATKRKKIFPKLFIYHAIQRKKNQLWYFQTRVKLQMDFTYLSERNNIFYVHNKLKNKIFNQMQTWVKTMTEREIFSV